MALTKKAMGDLAGARALQELVLEVHTRTLPAEHHDLLSARVELAATRGSQGDFRGAHTVFEQVLEVRMRTLPPEHPDLLSTKSRLAVARQALGDLAGARVLQEQVLEVRERILPPDHADLQLARGNLAVTLMHLRDPAGARVLQERVLDMYARTLPPEHPDLQRARAQLGATLNQLGDLAGARGLQEHVLDVYTRTLPLEHPELQRARANLGSTLNVLGDLAGARALHEQVLEVLTRTRHPEDLELQSTRANLASTLHYLNDLAGARALFSQVLEVQERVLPAEHPSLLSTRVSLAGVLMSLGELVAARKLQEQVLEVQLRTLSPDNLGLQMTRTGLAATLQTLGDLAGARMLEEQVLEAYARTLPADHPDLLRARGNLAVTIKQLGDLAGARVLEEKVLEIQTRTLPPEHADLQRTRANMASTLSMQGDLAGARALYELVLDVYARTLDPDHPELQRTRANLAATLRSPGDLVGKRALFEQVLEVQTRTLPAENRFLLATRANLAATLQKLGDLVGARAQLEQVLAVYERTLSPEHPDLQNTRSNLAGTLRRLGDIAGARELDEQVLEVQTRTLPPDHPLLQRSRASLAVTLAALGELAHSAAGAQGGASETCIELLRASCAGHAAAARTALLGSSFREAEARGGSSAEHVHVVTSFALGYGRLEPLEGLEAAAFTLGELTRGAGLTAARLARGASAAPDYKARLEASRRAAEELGELGRTGTTSADFQAAIARRDELQRELVRQARELAPELVDALEFDVEDVRARLIDGDALIAYRRFPRSSMTFGDGAADAAPRERKVESLCAFVLRPVPSAQDAQADDGLTLIDLGPIEPIEAAIRAWRPREGLEAGRGLAALPPELSDPTHGHEIRRAIFDPLSPALAGAKRLIVALDDVLHLVPIDALPLVDPQAGVERPELLGERYAVETRSTLVELLMPAALQPGGNVILALGAVSYDAEPRAHDEDVDDEVIAADATPSAPEVARLLRGGAWSAGFTPLPATGPEARRVASLFEQSNEGNVLVLEERRASRASLVELAPRARWLHIATHGWFAPESIRSWRDADLLEAQAGSVMRLSGDEQVRGMSPMLLCGLALAGANLPEDLFGRAPGLITAEEIASLDLTNCELAVLSACDTNVGERRAGQGVASLQKALHIAGAKSAITSLWKVPDEATRELMLEFYRLLWVEKLPKSRALWQAKMRMRDAKDEAGRARYGLRDWAGWVLTGEPN